MPAVRVGQTAGVRPLLMPVLLLALPFTLSAQAGSPPPPTPPPSTPVTAPTGQTAAQKAAQAAAGRPVSNTEIADAIRRSGLSQADVRAQLQAKGYDPSMADPFFAATGAGAAGAALGSPAGDFAQALQALGIMSPGTTAEPGTEGEKSTAATATRAAGGASVVFGKDVFQRASTAFDPLTSGPVDPAYRLGIGDQLQLVLTGDVELAYALDVRRDGTLIIPQVGQVSIAGLTLDGARSFLRQRMGQSYSGLATGNTRLDLSISRVRTNAVFVIGEVEEPGVYQVNALSTAFHALARAGGPTTRGSFRRVEVRRAGKVVQTMDLYRYLVDGDAGQDVRLEQGDVIFVPLNDRAVAIAGAIRRPRIFELRPTEGFSALLRYAGGVTATAASDRVQVDRILPPDQRAPGLERVKVDVRLEGNLQRAEAFPLVDGDLVTVFTIGDVRRNVVTLQGAVFRPGEFEYRPGLSLDSLIRLGQGTLPSAIRDRYLVQRPDPATGRTYAINVPGDSAARYVLSEFDAVEVLDGRRDYPAYRVAVTGAVNSPADSLPYLASETLRALVDRAGGFAEGALTVQVAQRKLGVTFSDTTSVVITFNALQDFAPGGRASQFVLSPEDRVDVRVAPGYRPQRFVRVTGAFKEPGTYAVLENVDRVGVLVQRAGGLLPIGNLASMRLIRDGLPVAVDFARVLQGSAKDNLLLRDGDELVADVDARTVKVVGAVANPTLVRWEPGRSALDYIELAGGPSERGQPHKAVVTSPAGTSQRVKRVLRTVTLQPPVTSGATITVPAKPESTGGQSVLATTLQVASTLASLAIAFRAIQ